MARTSGPIAPEQLTVVLACCSWATLSESLERDMRACAASQRLRMLTPPTTWPLSALAVASVLVGFVVACPGPPVGSHRSGPPRKRRSVTRHYSSSELGSAGTSTACFRSAAIGTICSTASLVEASTTGAATPSL